MRTIQKLYQTYISLFSFAFDEDVPAIRKPTSLGANTDVVLGGKIVEECFKGNAMCEQNFRKNRQAILALYSKSAMSTELKPGMSLHDFR